jgi:hypothetical protein
MDTDEVVATEATGARTRVDDTHMFRWWKMALEALRRERAG